MTARDTVSVDLVLVPRHATKAMRRAATDAMRRFHEANPDAGWVSSGAKAGIRWDAMVEAGMGEAQAHEATTDFRPLTADTFEARNETSDAKRVDCAGCGGTGALVIAGFLFCKSITGRPFDCPRCRGNGWVYRVKAGRGVG